MEEPLSLSSEVFCNENYIFITGIGTEVGKTFISSKICQQYHYDYWKPIQTGFESEDTDSTTIRRNNPNIKIYEEAYSFPRPVSPHAEARRLNIEISLDKIKTIFNGLKKTSKKLLVEGAGGIYAPIGHNIFMIDLILALQIPVLVVTREYLGSLNHTILSHKALIQKDINVLAYIFNGDYSKEYIQDLTRWLGG